MYPMTATDIHSGWVRGVERIVTKKPGVYGWRGDRALHRVVRCDARGALVPNGDFGTADASGVRTQLNLKPMESAVVIRLPVRIECDQPVNFLVEKLDADECVVRLNGKGAARLVAEGPSAGKLAGAEVRVTLSGETQVRIAPAKP
jgi:hypothetical protein